MACTIFYYVKQEEHINYYKLINDVDNLLEIHEIDILKLYPGSWVKLMCNFSKLICTPALFAFFILHVFEKEKYLTLQIFPRMLACYRGSLGLTKLIIINNRYTVLNDILKKFIKQKYGRNCVICIHHHFNNRIRVLPGKMCYKHTIM